MAKAVKKVARGGGGADQKGRLGLHNYRTKVSVTKTNVRLVFITLWHVYSGKYKDPSVLGYEELLW